MSKLLAVVSAAALAAISAPAVAVGNSGFEFGNTNQWNRTSDRGNLRALSSAVVRINDDAYPDPSDPNYLNYQATVTPLEGSFMGLLSMPGNLTPTGRGRETASFRFRAPRQKTGTLDVFWVRLFTADYLYAPFGYNDRVNIRYNGDLGTFTDSIEALDLGNSPDSGWIGFAVPLGTKTINVALVNVFDSAGSNTPRVALDYGVGGLPAGLAPTATAVTAVPEPSTYALLAGGLGLVAFAAKRRKQRDAA